MPNSSDLAQLSAEEAWAPYSPTAENPWDAARAAHLLRRSGAGPSWGDIARAIEDGPEKTTDRLLRGDGAEAFNREIDGYEVQGPNARPIAELRGWWLRRMIETPHPLLERMTVFWHGWFAVNAARVGQPRAVLDHVRILRRHALGSFDAMLGSAVRDPATLITGNGVENFKAKANDHLAEYMLSRLTVGDGAFTPEDVPGTARAFTGLFVRGGVLREVHREHDPAEKMILGCRGPWTHQDFARIAAAHPSTARRIVKALYRFFISEETGPPDRLIEPLVAAFAKDREIGSLLKTLLQSSLFFSRHAYRRRIKSPVDFAVGLCRAFEKTVPTVQLGQVIAELGQDLYHPPTTSGWAGGVNWINQQTMVGRINLAHSLFNGEARLEAGPILQKYARDGARTPADFLGELLIQERCPEPIGAGRGAEATAEAIASCAEYQMA